MRGPERGEEGKIEHEGEEKEDRGRGHWLHLLRWFTLKQIFTDPIFPLEFK